MFGVRLVKSYEVASTAAVLVVPGNVSPKERLMISVTNPVSSSALSTHPIVEVVVPSKIEALEGAAGAEVLIR
jgi:hypothetical protein